MKYNVIYSSINLFITREQCQLLLIAFNYSKRMFVHVQIPQPITNDLTFITPICRAERFKILCLLARRQLSL